ncbi:DUF4132 domain-containing protein [Rhodococcoides trifolii]|uniref:DUF4132 domain-containing protein n=1 Tax=Rhodococcoides trifolii TaxID=908250 RepID=UPI001666213B|nr:DUF4132 domain-containing protein [Rhodococcus trifolii]
MTDPETQFAPPAAWLPMRYPRHGGFPARAKPVDPGAGDALDNHLEKNEQALHWAAWELENNPEPHEWVIAARRYLAGDVTAVGAAAAYVVLTRAGIDLRDRKNLVVDGWVARYGLPFAVEAAMRASDMGYVRTRVPVPTNSGHLIIVMENSDNAVSSRYSEPSHYEVEVLAQVDDPDKQIIYTPREYMLDRLRELLAVTSEESYAAARDLAAPLRSNTVRRLTASFLFPTERQWSDDLTEHLRATPYHWQTHLYASCNTVADVKRAEGEQWGQMWLNSDEITAAVVEGVGTAITPLLVAAADEPIHYYSSEKDARLLRILHAFSAIPTDEAFTALLHRANVKNGLPALLHAMTHFPRRALRLLAQEESTLFDRHVLQNRTLAIELADSLPDRHRRRIVDLTTEVPVADDLPGVLAVPPWTENKLPAQTVVVDDLTAPHIQRIDWLPGEVEELKNSRHEFSYYTWEQQSQYFKDTKPQDLHEWYALTTFLIGPEDVARKLLSEWPGTTLKEPLRVVARFELEALPFMLRMARAHPGAAAPYLMPFVDLDVARLHATMFATRKNLRKPALAWLVRHADDAVTLLMPDAIGPLGAQRDHAEAALRGLASATTRETVIEGARQFGPEAVTAAKTIVDFDPLQMLPKRIPRTPPWVDIEWLPPILVSDRAAKLPTTAVANILTMCAIGTVDAPYAGLETVNDFCDRASLASTMWEVFERWWGDGAPSKDNWAIMALGWLGDDSVVSKLAPLIRRWPGESGTARAQLGLDALAALGSSRALTELDHIARNMKFKSLKSGAAQRVAEVAESLGLDREQLADRIVPDLDLASDGTMTFEYGTRSFTVGFNEALVPYVVDDSGKKSASLPKPKSGDDAVLAEESKQKFAALKREAKTVAAEQVKRLNRSMVIGRRWSPDEFRTYVLGHPLMIHVARRLLWASFDGTSPAVVFRVAEDSTLADIDDSTVELPDGPIGLVHPAHIPDTVGTWSDVFADYEILQPFPQLGRAVRDPLPGDFDGTGLSRFTGVTATPSQALRLTYRGWEPVWENPDGWGQGLLYRLSDDVSVLLGLEPGMGTGDPYNGYPDQTLRSVTLRGGTLDDVDRAAVSELIADLDGFAT